jgi:hypothetical protein
MRVARAGVQLWLAATCSGGCVSDEAAAELLGDWLRRREQVAAVRLGHSGDVTRILEEVPRDNRWRLGPSLVEQP